MQVYAYCMSKLGNVSRKNVVFFVVIYTFVIVQRRYVDCPEHVSDDVTLLFRKPVSNLLDSSVVQIFKKNHPTTEPLTHPWQHASITSELKGSINLSWWALIGYITQMFPEQRVYPVRSPKAFPVWPLQSFYFINVLKFIRIQFSVSLRHKQKIQRRIRGGLIKVTAVGKPTRVNNNVNQNRSTRCSGQNDSYSWSQYCVRAPSETNKDLTH